MEDSGNDACILSRKRINSKESSSPVRGSGRPNGFNTPACTLLGGLSRGLCVYITHNMAFYIHYSQ